MPAFYFDLVTFCGYNQSMNASYDQQKNAKNIEQHGVSFNDLWKFEWIDSVTLDDNRKDYGEQRHISYGFVGERLHVLVWTKRDGVLRPISFRKANKREVKLYENEKNSEIN